VCKMGPQTTDHLIWECEQLRKPLKNRIRRQVEIGPCPNLT